MTSKVLQSFRSDIRATVLIRADCKSYLELTLFTLSLSLLTRTYPFLVWRLWIFLWGKSRFGSDIVEAAGVPTNEYGRPKWGFITLFPCIGALEPLYQPW